MPEEQSPAPSSDPIEFPTLGSADVAIFWDFENVRIPAWCPTSTASEGIRNKVAKYGRIVEKRLYYDSRQPTESNAPRSELDLSGFTLVDCPSRNRKETLDKKLIVDVLCFAWERASRGAKACVVLITSDGDYSYALARLRDIGVFTVIFYRPDNVAKVLIDNANVVMSWEFDVLGGSPLAQDEEDEDVILVASEEEDGKTLVTSSTMDDEEDKPEASVESQPNDNHNQEKRKILVQEGVGIDPLFARLLGHAKATASVGSPQADPSVPPQADASCIETLDSDPRVDGTANDSTSVIERKNDEDMVISTELQSPSDSSSIKVSTQTTGLEAVPVDKEVQKKEDIPLDTITEVRPASTTTPIKRTSQPAVVVRQPNSETRGKFAIFCTVVLNAQQRNVKEGISVYSSWADEGNIASNFYAKVGEKDRDGYLHIRTMASQKKFIEWGRRNLTVPGKPVIKVTGRDDKPDGSSSETYARLTYSGLAVLKPNVAVKEGDWNLVSPKTRSKLAAENEGYAASSGKTPTKHCNGKLFVGGLAWQTTADSLRSYFRQFGPVNSVIVMEGRGFGYVFFRNHNDAEIVLKNAGDHFVDSKSVEYVTSPHSSQCV